MSSLQIGPVAGSSVDVKNADDGTSWLWMESLWGQWRAVLCSLAGLGVWKQATHDLFHSPTSPLLRRTIHNNNQPMEMGSQGRRVIWLGGCSVRWCGGADFSCWPCQECSSVKMWLGCESLLLYFLYEMHVNNPRSNIRVELIKQSKYTVFGCICDFAKNIFCQILKRVLGFCSIQTTGLWRCL